LQHFLRALTHAKWGLSMAGVTQDYVAGWLTSLPEVEAACGSITVAKVKNASRRDALPVEGCVPATPQVLALVRALLTQFPTMEARRFFDPTDWNAVDAGVAE
jgi:hypothetical protein